MVISTVLSIIIINFSKVIDIPIAFQALALLLPLAAHILNVCSAAR